MFKKIVHVLVITTLIWIIKLLFQFFFLTVSKDNEEQVGITARVSNEVTSV
jgi:hypothetical protein